MHPHIRELLAAAEEHSLTPPSTEPLGEYESHLRNIADRLSGLFQSHLIRESRTLLRSSKPEERRVGRSHQRLAFRRVPGRGGQLVLALIARLRIEQLLFQTLWSLAHRSAWFQSGVRGHLRQVDDEVLGAFFTGYYAPEHQDLVAYLVRQYIFTLLALRTDPETGKIDFTSFEVSWERDEKGRLDVVIDTCPGFRRSEVIDAAQEQALAEQSAANAFTTRDSL